MDRGRGVDSGIRDEYPLRSNNLSSDGRNWCPRRSFKTTGRIENLTGSGFIVSPSGYVLTNDRLVSKPEDVDDVLISVLLVVGREKTL
jgi:S1-C subfamily serine protease